MSDERSFTPEELARARVPLRGRPPGAKDTTPRKPYTTKKSQSVFINGDRQESQGHRKLRGAQMLKVQQEIVQRAKTGQTLAMIETEMNLAKGAAFRNLYGTNERQLMKLTVDEIFLDTFLIVAEGCEVVKNEIVHMKVKSAMGELNLSPEQLGTFVRTIDKARELHHAITGKPLLGIPGTVKKEEPPEDPALERARERLKTLEAEGGTVAE